MSNTGDKFKNEANQEEDGNSSKTHAGTLRKNQSKMNYKSPMKPAQAGAIVNKQNSCIRMHEVLGIMPQYYFVL